MERSDIKKILEALFFIAEQPVTLKTLETLFDPPVPGEELRGCIQELVQEVQLRSGAMEIREIAGGWQMSTRPEFAPYIRRLFKDRLTYRLSHSAMETLSIVAYKQPITRHEIEEIRGVEVTGVLDTLVERRLVRIAGRRESIGRPLLYGTTPEFLKAFGLKRLDDLPSVETLVPPKQEQVDAQQLNLEQTAAVEPISGSAVEEEAGAVAAPVSSEGQE